MSTPVQSDPIADLYRATRAPRLLVVPAMRFLSVDGQGDPETSEAYAGAVQALFAVSYAAKFALRKAGGEDFRVSPLEGLWWASDLGAFATGTRSEWQWRMMIHQPDELDAELVDRLTEQVAAKKELPVARGLRLITFEEEPAAQVLHVGPYATEQPTIERLHAFVHEQGLTLTGHHHEIYLGDPRRAAPERLRTIIRQPCTELPG